MTDLETVYLGYDLSYSFKDFIDDYPNDNEMESIYYEESTNTNY